jgi:hypothetical protein
MPEPNVFVAGDTGSRVMLTIRNAVTGQLMADIVSATLRWRIDSGPTHESTMEVDAPNSVVSYQFGTYLDNENVEHAELTPGLLRYEAQITDSAGDTLTIKRVQEITIRDSL